MEKSAVRDEKIGYAINALIPAFIYLVFYNIGSYFFFKKTDVLASVFGAIVFWTMYFFLQVIGGRVEKKSRKK